MNIAIDHLIADALTQAPNALLYDLSRQLAKTFPKKAILETADCDFNLGTYHRDGLCKIALKPEFHQQFDTSWLQFQHRAGQTHRNTWHEVEWEGHTLDVVTVSFMGSHGYINRRVYILSDTPDIAQAFFESVCNWMTEVRGEILVYSGSWYKDNGLFNSIQNASLSELVLDGNLKEQIRDDLLSFFESEETYAKYGVPWKRGVLLLGPPGNGKTHAIKALANLLGKPCLYVKTFKGQYTTEHACIHEVFERARATAPCILVLEDLDSLLHDKNRSFFLNEMDGFASNRGIITIATTNHPEKLDPAILERPSRFDRKYTFDLPDLDCRRAYMALRNETLESALKLEDRELDSIAAITDGFSFAYLKELFLSSMVQWITGDRRSSLAKTMSMQIDALRSQMTTVQPEVISPFVDLQADDDEDDD